MSNWIDRYCLLIIVLGPALMVLACYDAHSPNLPPCDQLVGDVKPCGAPSRDAGADAKGDK